MWKGFSAFPEPSKYGGGRAAERVPGRYLDSPLEREARYSAMDSAPSGSYPDIPASRWVALVPLFFFFVGSAGRRAGKQLSKLAEITLLMG